MFSIDGCIMNDRSHATRRLVTDFTLVHYRVNTVRGGKRKRKRDEHWHKTRGRWKRLGVNLAVGLIIQAKHAVRRCIDSQPDFEPISISSNRSTTSHIGECRLNDRKQRLTKRVEGCHSTVPTYFKMPRDRLREKRDKLLPFYWNS